MCVSVPRFVCAAGFLAGVKVFFIAAKVAAASPNNAKGHGKTFLLFGTFQSLS